MRRLLLVALLAATPVFAVQPDEVLKDPTLEHRAREIGRVLRCPVCQGETIDDSNAPISRDLRLYVRERLVAGDSDQQVITAVSDRFGEFVLFEPPKSGWSLLLWLAGPVLAGLGLIAAFLYARARNQVPVAPAAPLSPDEQARLARILDGDQTS